MAVKKKSLAGAKPKAPGGLTRVLYIRCTQATLDALDELAERERSAHPGRSVSRADVAREILARAVAK